MIERVPTVESGQVVLVLHPNRMLDRRGLRGLIGGLAVAAMGVAALAAWQGNVFAPLFALVELPCVGLALALAWRAGDRAERITLDAHDVRIEAIPPRGAAIALPSAWVRLRWREWGGHRHLLLAAAGREREVGGFLGDGERLELSERLRTLLTGMTNPTGVQGR